MSQKTLIGTLYHSKLDKKARKPFREQVLKDTGVHFTTFYNWVNGITAPNKACQSVIINALNQHLGEGAGISEDEISFGRYEKK
jgi:hypothetical protein